MANKIVLLPCPFCGKTPYLTEGWCAPAGVGQAWGIDITCASRKCKVHPQVGGYVVNAKDKAICRREVIKNWNKRKV